MAGQSPFARATSPRAASAERGDRYAIDDLGAERVGEEVARGRLRQAAAAQIEHRVVVEPADRRAVRAFHVVGKDLELRLGIDLRLGAEQQVAARLRRVRLLRVRVHEDLAVEHRVRGAADDALVKLAAHPVRLPVIDRRVRVGKLALADHREPVDRAARALRRLRDGEVVARKARPKRDAHRVEARPGGERHRGVADVERLAALALHANVIDARVLGERDLRHRVGEIRAVVQRDEVLDDRCSAAAAGDDERARVARRVLLVGDEQQMHRRGDGSPPPAR